MDLLIYGVIGVDELQSKIVVEKIMAFRGTEINVFINSVGGYAHEGNAIAAALERHPANVSVYVDGFALSAASRIMVAGDSISIAPDARVMIHEAFSRVDGFAREMRKTADRLDKVSARLAEAYAKRTGETPERMLELMKVETWYDADEAVAVGLADEIVSDMNAGEMKHHEIFNSYRNVPAAFSNPLEGNSQPMTNEKPTSVAPKNETEQPEAQTIETDQPEADVVDQPADDQPETDQADTVVADQPEANADGERNECRLFINAFGNDGGEYYASGLTFEEAQAKHNVKQQERIKQLEKQAASNASAEANPVSVVDENQQTNKKNTFGDLLSGPVFK